MVEPRPEYLDLVRAGDRSALDRLGEAPELAGARDAAGVPAVLVALYHGHRDLAAALFATGAQADAAVLAALGEVEALRAALETDPEARDRRTPDGFQPLHLAAFFAREAALSLLLDRGADVDAIADQPARMRPIHAAAASRSAGPVMALSFL